MQVTDEFNMSTVYNYKNNNQIQSTNTTIANIDLSNSKHHIDHNKNRGIPYHNYHDNSQNINVNMNQSQTQDDTFWSFNNS